MKFVAGAVSLLLALAVYLAPPSQALFFFQVSTVIPDAFIGETVPATLGLNNSSTAPQNFPVTFRDIDLVPACSTANKDCTPGTIDPDVYALPTTGTGVGPVGSGCTGTWTIVQTSPGLYRFNPPAGPGTAVTLAPGETCVVNFTATALSVPDTGATTPANCLPAPPAGSACTAHVTTASVAQEAGQPPRNASTATFSAVLQTTPALSTDTATVPPQPSPTIPGTTTDTAHLESPPPPGSIFGAAPTGTINFSLFGPFQPGDPIVCTGAPVTGTPVGVPVNGFGDYTTPPINVTTAGTYTWVATYTGDANYIGSSTACADPDETFTFVAAQPTIVTTATPSPGPVPPGTILNDSATLANGFFPPGTPPGTIVFNLYGPLPAAPTGTECVPANLFATVTVNGVAANGIYNSGPIAANGPGFYTWVASFTPGAGDVNNLPAANACGETSETTEVARAQPAIVTAVSAASVAQGTPVTDTATISGLAPTAAPLGTVSFSVFGPFPIGSPATCTGAPTVLGSPNNPVAANGAFTSDPFLPPGAGEYFFTASYTGDPNNLPVTTACGDANEQVTVIQATPTLVTQASNNPPAAAAPLGSAISDTATIAGLVNPVVAPAPGSGTITFTAYGPDDATCTTVAYTSTQPVPGNGSVNSAPPPFVPTAPGTYRWIAVYSGDANNAPVSTACADPLEASVVTRSTPTLVTQASNNPPAAPAALGTPISDTATIAGLNNPVVAPAPGSGTIEFTAYGPDDATCTTIAFTSTQPVAGNGSVNSAPPQFIPTAPGTYRWIARYSGDVNNNPVATACADPLESSVVVPAQPAIVTQAFGPVTLGQPVRDTATISGLVNPDIVPPGVGTITFRLFDAGDTTCANAFIFESVVPVSTGNGAYTSADFTPTAVGSYNWTATYSGDANNLTASSPCQAPGETSVVTAVPTILVDKTATPLSRTEPGGAFTFNVVVTNTSNETLTITSLTDNIYGDLTSAANPNITNNTCTTAPGTVLAPAGTYSCQFDGNFTGVAGAAQTDIVTVTATNPAGVTVTDNDDAVVTLTPVPTIVVDKTATPLTQAEPGGDFTFNVVVTNTSSEVLTITTLTDDVYGDLDDPANPNITNNTCLTAVGTALQPSPGPGNTFSCSFTGPFTGNSGDFQVDVVTVTATNPSGVTVTDTDDARVDLTGDAPQIQVVKDATPLTRNEPGGVFTYNLVVTNPDTLEAVTITTLTDDVYGDLDDPANPDVTNNTCLNAVGTVLQPSPGPGNTFSCSFDATFTGDDGDAQTDIVTVTGVDDDGDTVSDTDDATVSITGDVPIIAVDKTATPASLPEPGGTFTFNVVVTNLSSEPVTITTLTDNIYGDLTTRTGSTCNTAIGTVLAASPGPGNTYSCSFTGPFNGNAGAQQTDIVTATAVDDDGDTATADDDAIVAITNVLPAIIVEKSASPTSRPEPGGTFQFNVVVSNVGPEALTITSLTDNIYGNIATQGTCTTAIGTVLQPGGSYSCSFPGNFTGNAGAQQTDIVTVVGQDNDGSSVSDTDDATVTLTGVPPTVLITKTPTPQTLPEPGGQFTFNFVVTNTSNETITITDLTDDVYGNLNGRGTCATGAVLVPGAQYTCSFTVTFTGPPGASQRDVVTVRAVDDDGQSAVDDDDAIIRITDLPPLISVQKTANPLVRNEPGGSFTFTVVITNVGPEDVTITDLTDDVYGNLNGRGTCAVGAVLQHNGGTYTCSFTADFIGNAGASQTDVVTASGVDNDGTRTTARDDAVVRLVDVPPTVTVIKDADPLSRPDPGGSFTFFVTVTNTSFEPVTLVSLTDDVYGNLNGRGTCAIGAVIQPGASYRCNFTVDFRGPGGSSQVDRVFATVVDNDGSRASANDDARISITPLPPVVVPPPATPPPTASPAPLVRTGSDVGGPARLALGLLVAGLLMLGATWGSGEGRRLAVAGGPGRGPGRSGPGGRGPGGRGPGGPGRFGGLAARFSRSPSYPGGTPLGFSTVDDVLPVEVVDAPGLPPAPAEVFDFERPQVTDDGIDDDGPDRPPSGGVRPDRDPSGGGSGGASSALDPPVASEDSTPVDPEAVTIAERAASSIAPGGSESAVRALLTPPPTRRPTPPEVTVSTPELRVTRLF